MLRRLLNVIALLFAAAVLAGCSSDHPMNPAFPVPVAQAQRLLDEMHENPKPLERPVVVAAGYFDPGLISRNLARRLQCITSDGEKIIHVSFFWRFNFDDCRERLIDAVERNFPNDDPHLTTEVDVIGFSMGGLVARYAASPRADGSSGKRLNIARLFTLGTPHRGARLAPLAPFDRRAVDMRAQSNFLSALDKDLKENHYEIVPYVRLRDAIVGAGNAAPPGREPWWVPNRAFSLSHNMAGSDPRILADIARRLRGEAPLTREPAVSIEASRNPDTLAAANEHFARSHGEED